jgi:hypothetical protein
MGSVKFLGKCSDHAASISRELNMGGMECVGKSFHDYAAPASRELDLESVERMGKALTELDLESVERMEKSFES